MIADEVYQEYEEWLETASIVQIKDLATGDIQRRLSPKRGNLAYARKKRGQLNEYDQLMKGLVFDAPVKNSRTHRDCMMFLVTCTYNRSYSIEEAWKRVTNDQKKARISLKRRLEEALNGMTKREYGKRKRRGMISKEWQTISIRSMTVKEGQKDGYPAPHTILILDRPIRCIRYTSKRGEVKRIVQNQKLWRAIKSSWPYGHSDINGIVKNKVGKRSAAGYVMKYLTKAVKSGEHDLAFKTMAWQKHYNLRPMHVSSQFKEMLNPVRLDTILSESQQVSGHMWVFDRVEYVKLSDFDNIMLKSNFIDKTLPK
jgi:hypothetical protein